MSGQILGRVYIYLNGALLRSKPGAKLTNFLGVERKPVIGNEVHGFAEEAVAPSIECGFSLAADTSLTDIGNFQGNATFEGDNGKTLVIHEAWVENAMDISAGEGEVELKITGVRCEEQN